MKRTTLHQTQNMTCDGLTIFEYGYHYLVGNTDAYVSLTHLSKHSAGMVTKEMVAEYCPELLPLLRWHGCGVETGPMHYIANARYWWDWIHGKYEPGPYDNMTPAKARQHLLNHIVYGSLDSDLLYDPAGMTLENLTKWLKDRLPALVKQLRADCDPIVMEVKDDD